MPCFRLFTIQKFPTMAGYDSAHPMARGLLVRGGFQEDQMPRAAQWLLRSLLSLILFLPAEITAQSHTENHELFPLLPGLEKPVEFWRKIFTQYGTSQLVFFDVADMTRIFEVQDVGEGSRTNEYINTERSRIAALHGVEVERVKAQRGIRERTEAGLRRSGRYIAFMKKVFRERGLPEELAYLPLVESSFDLTARSSAGATGMWQFMRATGKEYMRVDRHIDERIDPIESTRAAASYLSQAYQSLGNWPLAITSYNYGQAGIARAVAQVESDNLVDLINDYSHPYWGYAPKNFYAEFLVALEIGKNHEQYFPGLQLDAPANFREVPVRGSSSIGALASAAGLTRDEFLNWNPAIHPNARSIPAGYQMKLPAESGTQPLVLAAVKQAEEKPKSQAKIQALRHRVKRGETVFEIARRYGASVERILEANGLRHANLIQVGALLLIPRK
jgi:membrane-bound lytic murein transglycosylase D